MINKELASTVAFVFLLFVANSGLVFAHSLPGSVLVLWRQDAQLNLSIRLPIEDLVVAASQFKYLDNLRVGHELSAKNTKRLAAYFSAHLNIQKGDVDLPLAMTHAALDLEQAQHVGHYKSLVISFVALLPAEGAISPLNLSYGAVMHEVRSHRATVYWGRPDNNPMEIADFGFHQQPVGLTLK